MSSNWDGSINFSSYDQVESFANYRSDAELDAYRSERLAFCEKHIDFLLGIVKTAPPFSATEVGAGSSALLYSMEIRGLLKSGCAIELSESRHQFAERWKQQKGFVAVTNHCADFATAPIDAGASDLFLCMDNTYSYIGPEDARYPALLVDRAFTALRPGGVIAIETHNQSKIIAEMINDERRLWKELPQTNAFKFALYMQSLNRTENLIRSESVYVGRDGSERRKVEMETVYTQPGVEAILAQVGFEDICFFGDYDFSKFTAAESEYLIAVARKPLF
jgi:SAM-dependent methyltransferase